MNSKTLMRQMPGYYQTSRVISSLSGAQAQELSNLEQHITNVFCQFFVDTADYTLSRWEQELGLDVNSKLDVSFRRSRILSKLRGQGTVTVRLIKSVAESFSNAESEIIENPAEYKFVVKFVGTKGIPPNMDDLRAALEDCKPAHLAFDFEYTYNTWDMVSHLTWDEVSHLTWEQLKTR